eukprot:4439526-Alexandrium_andersonii.AAC.1
MWPWGGKGRDAPAGSGQGSAGRLRAPPDLELALIRRGLREAAKGLPSHDRGSEGGLRARRDRAVVEVAALVGGRGALSAADHRRGRGRQEGGAPS